MEQIRQGYIWAWGDDSPERELAEQLKISGYTVRRAIEGVSSRRSFGEGAGQQHLCPTEPPGSPRQSNTIGIVMPFSDAEVKCCFSTACREHFRIQDSP